MYSNICNAFESDVSRTAALFSLLTPLLLCGISEEQASGVGLGGGPRIELCRSSMDIVSNSAQQLIAGDELRADHQSVLGQREQNQVLLSFNGVCVLKIK